MKQIFTCIFTLISGLLAAQYTTPDEGITIDFDFLVENSGGAVVMEGDDYLITEDITIAVSDVLEETTSISVLVSESALITVHGGLMLSNSEGISFTWADEGNHYEGFRFEDGSDIELEYVTFEYGGGLRVLTNNFRMFECTVSHQEMLASTGGALGLSYGKPEIINCHFIENVTAAINSAANSTAAPIIENCTFRFNGTSIVNKSQINLGPTGTDTTFIRGNVVEGHPDNILSGGIAIAVLIGGEGHAVIEENEVFNNRYGIAFVGSNITSLVRANHLYDNDIQDDPMLGGSGVNLNSAGGNNHAVLTENVITGHLWGMTLQGEATANLGDTTEANYNAGLNVFEDNMNNGVTYALFNNTPNTLMAMNNCWDGFDNELSEAEAEALITHQADDEDLGLVIYTPLGFCSTVGIDENDPIAMTFFPNPAKDQLTIQTDSEITSISVLDISGKTVLNERINSSMFIHHVSVSNLKSGPYILQVTTPAGVQSSRFVKE